MAYIFFRATTHKQVFMVPRQWLACKNLECILYTEIKFYYLTFGTYEGFIIKLKGIRACVVCHLNYFWAREAHDWAEKPRIRKYLAVYIPCVYCCLPRALV